MVVSCVNIIKYVVGLHCLMTSRVAGRGVTGAACLRRLAIPSLESLCVSPDGSRLTTGAPDHQSPTNITQNHLLTSRQVTENH